MNKLLINIILILFTFNYVMAQQLPADICKINNGELEFTLNLDWTRTQQKELRDKYNLDSLMIEELYRGKRNFTIDGEKWTASAIDENRLLLHKPVQKKSLLHALLFNLFETFQEGDRPDGYVHEKVTYGFNNFQRQSVVMNNENATFKLFNHENATDVLLAGSFNNWNTENTPMIKNNEGWYVNLKLEPGKYYYKFIVDGQWLHDPNNFKTEPDGVSGLNSVLFVTNHIFTLKNHQSAKSVVVSGSFNNWNLQELHMTFTNGKWELPIFLNNGKYSYKFIVDGQWIVDPGNNTTVQNKFLTENSVITIGEGIKFFLPEHLNAKNVFLAGSFNDWKGDNTPMYKTDSGWKTTQFLNPGNYEYKFVIDGNWIPDPINEDTHGTDVFENSFLVHKPNHTFILDSYPNAKTVFVTGTFNNWIHHGYKMKRVNNRWELSLYLPKGKTKYKFIVDGQWIADPNNPEFEQNEFQTFDSVLWKD